MKLRRLIAGPIVMLAVAAAALPAALAAPSARKLTATVGPGFTIAVQQNGRKVTRLPTGVYTIQVRDRSSSHNFKLQGPGVERATTIRFVGTKTWRVTLKRGVYSFECDPHDDSMSGLLRVA